MTYLILYTGKIASVLFLVVSMFFFLTRWCFSDSITASLQNIDASMVELSRRSELPSSGHIVSFTPVPYRSGNYGCGIEQRYQLLHAALRGVSSMLRMIFVSQHISDRKVILLAHHLSSTLHLAGKYDCIVHFVSLMLLFLMI